MTESSLELTKVPLTLFLLQILRSELKEREHLVNSTLDQARMFLADQPIEGPGEPRMNLQSKTGTFALNKKHLHISG